jgi:hypothetical protein
MARKVLPLKLSSDQTVIADDGPTFKLWMRFRQFRRPGISRSVG